MTLTSQNDDYRTRVEKMMADLEEEWGLYSIDEVSSSYPLTGEVPREWDYQIEQHNGTSTENIKFLLDRSSLRINSSSELEDKIGEIAQEYFEEVVVV